MKSKVRILESKNFFNLFPQKIEKSAKMHCNVIVININK